MAILVPNEEFTHLASEEQITKMEGEWGTGTDIGEETMSNVVKSLGEEDMLRGTPQTSTIQQVPARQSGVWVLLATILGSSMAFMGSAYRNLKTVR